MNFLQRLLKAIAERKETAIGLDIGSGSVKMAEVVMRGTKPFLKRAAVMELPEHIVEEGVVVDEDLLSEFLSRMAAKHGFASGNVAIALGGRSMFIREVVFPRMSDKELREAIHWDLDKYVPFSADQLYFDFWIIGPGSTEVDLRILLVAVPRELVDTLVRVVSKSGLKLVAIEIEPLAIQRTLPVTQDCMLIDIGADVSQVTLFQNKCPVFTRSIPIGGNRITEDVKESMQMQKEDAERLKFNGDIDSAAQKTDAMKDSMKDELNQAIGTALGVAEFEQFFSELSSEVSRTLEYYQVQNRSVSISQVFLTGGGSKTGNLSERLSQALDLPVMLHDPFADIDIAPSFNRKHLQGIGPQLAVAIGLAMRGLEE